MLKNSEDANLTKGSTKRVSLICDYCGDEFIRRWDCRMASNKFVNKDSCKKCSTKKREETSLIKYGTRIPSQSIRVRKAHSKNIGGSGDSPLERKNEILRLYQIEDMSIKEIAKRLNLGRTALRKYMVEIGLDTSGDMQAKAKRTCKERYGEEYYLRSKDGQEKIRKTFKEKFGDENLWNNEDAKRKMLNKKRKTMLNKYGIEDLLNCEERREEFERKRKDRRVINGQLMYGGKTIRELAVEKDMASSSLYAKVQKIGIERAIREEKRCSTLESIMKKILEELEIDFSTEFSIKGKIADFHIKNTNIILEVDGLYWHSDFIIKDRLHHVKKREHYIENGYAPLFFREDEIYNKEEIVKSILLNKLGKSKRVFARQCNVIQKKKKDGHSFMRDNHLMGSGAGQTFSLTQNGEDLCCMTIKGRGNNEFEISRFCPKIGYSVVGGFSKLLKFALSALSIPEQKAKLITFIDLRYGSGEYLPNFGFRKEGTHPTFRWTKSKMSFHRLKFKSNTGYEEGYYKVWDCGQAKYSLSFI